MGIAAIGTVTTHEDGRQYRKAGPNRWVPVKTQQAAAPVRPQLAAGKPGGTRPNPAAETPGLRGMARIQQIADRVPRPTPRLAGRAKIRQVAGRVAAPPKAAPPVRPAVGGQKDSFSQRWEAAGKTGVPAGGPARPIGQAGIQKRVAAEASGQTGQSRIAQIGARVTRPEVQANQRQAQQRRQAAKAKFTAQATGAAAPQPDAGFLASRKQARAKAAIGGGAAPATGVGTAGGGGAAPVPPKLGGLEAPKLALAAKPKLSLMGGAERPKRPNGQPATAQRQPLRPKRPNGQPAARQAVVQARQRNVDRLAAERAPTTIRQRVGAVARSLSPQRAAAVGAAGGRPALSGRTHPRDRLAAARQQNRFQRWVG